MGSSREAGSVAASILDQAHQNGQRLLSEPDGFALLSALGVTVPAAVRLDDVEVLDDPILQRIPGRQAVLKVISPELRHKSDIGGVEFVDLERSSIVRAARRMRSSVGARPVSGFFLQERIAGDGPVGSELLVNCRSDREFGPVLSVGAGGRHAELLAHSFLPDRAMAAIPLEGVEAGTLCDALRALPAVQLLTRDQRGRAPILSLAELGTQLMDFGKSALPLLTGVLREIEINPMVVRAERLVALDVLVEVGLESWAEAPPRPTGKLRSLLEPGSLAIIGVSRRLNVGRRILQNILARGFERHRITVIKPGLDQLDGCRCVPDVDALPTPVDLLIVAVAAAGVPPLVREVVDRRAAETVIVIPGGFGETTASAPLVESIEQCLLPARSTAWGGPLINGGNCMGIRSVPGRYDTFFLPDYKLPPMRREGGSVAIVAQSGAFLAAKGSKLESIAFRYQVSIGNQLDLTIADYLEYWLDDPLVRVVAVYAEGFRTFDGRRFLAAAREMHRQGRSVILYRGGRSAAGRRAAASHTAAIAGSYGLTAALAAAAGVLMTDTLDDFEDLVSLAARLEGRAPGGRRLVGLSNAGFECVALTDRLGWFTIAELGDSTRRELEKLLCRVGVESLVEVVNPLDLTPMADDEIFGRVADVMLSDPGGDAGVIGCVPLTGALQTLPAAEGHPENVERCDAVAGRLIEIWQRTSKPWVVVIDGGSSYDRLTRRLDDAGVPTFRTIDRAMRSLGRLLRYRSQCRPAADDG